MSKPATPCAYAATPHAPKQVSVSEMPHAGLNATAVTPRPNPRPGANGAVDADRPALKRYVARKPGTT